LAYDLAPRGAEALDEDRRLPHTRRERDSSENRKNAASGLFLAHALSVSDVMVAVETACHSIPSVRILREADLLLLNADRSGARNGFRWHVTIKKDGRAERIGLIPDTAFAVESLEDSGELRRLYYFVEVDRGTMPVFRKRLALSSIYRKALAYIESRRSGITDKQFAIFAFRVLFVTDGDERMNHIMHICQAANGNQHSTMFLFATQEELNKANNILLFPWKTAFGATVLLA
jgi:hypothetical protein